MTDGLYESYKEALRAGHVAVLRGALGRAAEAYRSAASIAPSRALPHTSLGGVMLRQAQVEEALAEYAVAVGLAPHDEGALLGQAEAMAMAGQRVDAARTLDHVSEIQEAAGRVPEAAETLRRALELENTSERSRRQRGLLRGIRLSEGDQAAEHLLARALRIRDEPSGTTTETIPSVREEVRQKPIFESEAAFAEESVEAAAVEPEPAADRVQASRAGDYVGPVDGSGGDEAHEPAWIGAFIEAASDMPASARVAMDRGPERAGEALWSSELVAPLPSTFDAALSTSLEPALEAVRVMADVFGNASPDGLAGVSQPQPTVDELLRAAEAADMAGDETTLRSLLLWTARAYARDGRFDAALDVTHRLVQQSPGDVDAHVVLVELYLARDWSNLAADKLVLLGRLAELNNDEATRRRLCAVARRAFPTDERLEALCA